MMFKIMKTVNSYNWVCLLCTIGRLTWHYVKKKKLYESYSWSETVELEFLF